MPNLLYSKLGIDFEELNQWRLAIGYFSVIKMQITQYNDIINTLSTSTAKCESGVYQHISIFTNQLSEMIVKFLDSITLPLETLELVVDEDVVEALRIIQSVLKDIKTVNKQISTLQKREELEQKINEAAGCMMILQPYVLKGARIKFNNNIE